MTKREGRRPRAAGLNTGATVSDLDRVFLEKNYPWVLKSKSEPHDFKPQGEACDGGCKAGCICDRCWETKSTRVHTKAFAREYARGQ